MLKYNIHYIDYDILILECHVIHLFYKLYTCITI